ncbi:MAG TPA: class I SAM-dependent methyltransferase [Candidatus Omnitrophota bacterium]|nr:class I SAM-dependent methyltransferase [Candidatus Omnitrophota bacterium]HPS19710.1 class I SAM-dependent methyltransferase [Candidatus Omnitrophota bacterium]
MNKRDFDKEAAVWDTPPRVGISRDIAQAVISRVPLTKEMSVLDFGCGTGLVAIAIKDKVKKITGVDTSEGMISVFLGKIEAQRMGNVEAKSIKELTEIYSKDEKYDLIFTSLTLHHVEDIGKCLAGFFDMIKPGGYVAIADLDEEGGRFHENNDGVFHFGFNRDEIKKRLSGIGFKDVRAGTAAEIIKPDRDKVQSAFKVFIITGKK